MSDEAPRIYVEPPVPTTTEFSTVEQVRAVINQHNSGRFRMSALLAERMLWNPRFRAVVNTRMAGLISAEVKFDPARETRDCRLAAREFAEDWPVMVTAPVRKQFRKWSLLLGFALAQRAQELSFSSGRQIYRLRSYWPGFASWYWSEGGYRIQTYDGGVVDVASPGLKDVGAPSPSMTSLINPSEQPWVIDEPNGANSWREAIIQAAFRPFLGHEWGSRDQARNSEKSGVGITKFYYPDGSGDEFDAAISKFIRDARNMGSEGSIPCKRGKDGDLGFDAMPFEFNGTGGQFISDTLNSCAVALAILFLGHNLTTEIKGGGSYAAAGVGEYIRDDIKHDDAAAEWACFGPQIARPYCLLNYGDPDVAPRARYITDSTAVNKAAAQTMLANAQALQILKVNVANFDEDAFCEKYGIPQRAKGSVQVPANVVDTSASASKPAEQQTDSTESTESSAEETAKADATLALTPSDLASIVKVDEGRKSIGLAPVGTDIGGKWIREHAAHLAAVLPVDPADAPAQAPATEPNGDEERDA